MMFARIAAPVLDGLRRHAASRVAVTMVDVACPGCETVCAVWMSNWRLYRPGSELGRSLGRPGENVTLSCPGCPRIYRTCGRAVAHNWYNHRPLLA